jgi:predicted phage tail protein
MPAEKESAKKAIKKEEDEEAVPSLALLTLESPDGFYTYLSIEKSTEIDEELVKKNYRRLSLKHHPDRRGGDEETFRALNRAQRVLLHAKLRQQYDILGLDLEEDEHHEHDGHEEDKKENESPTSPDTIVSHMASASLAAILQALIRTVMMGVVAVFVTRYWVTVLIAVAFLAFIAYRVRTVQGAANAEMLSPFMIAVGLLLMHKGRILPETTWSFTFWLGTH